jgi:hypothetical protein
VAPGTSSGNASLVPQPGREMEGGSRCFVVRGVDLLHAGFVCDEMKDLTAVW